MRRLALALLALASSAALAADGAGELWITGAVKRDLHLAPARLNAGTERALVKVPGAGGTYRATLEVEGVGLRTLLDEAQVEKPAPDGFDRPLDTWIEVVGRDGRRAAFAWGEIFAAGDAVVVIVADRARLHVPHHHEAIDARIGAFLDGTARARLDLEACASCHAGPKPAALDVPRGILVAAPRDPWPGRVVEDVIEIRVRQAGLAVAPADAKAASGPVRLVGLDGRARTLAPSEVRKLPRVELTDASFGMGRGFHGIHRSEGTRLANIVRPLLPKGIAPAEVLVLVTARDGYRSLFSGTEVFGPDGTLLVDREDGAALPSGVGPFRVLAPGDFFVDRSVRQVAEIRIIKR